MIRPELLAEALQQSIQGETAACRAKELHFNVAVMEFDNILSFFRVMIVGAGIANVDGYV